jgi:hypothetical protein
MLQLFFVVDVAGDRHGDLCAARLVDVGRDLVARIGLAARDDDFRAVLRQAMDDRFADAFGGTGHECNLAAQIEQIHGGLPDGL